eukprot:702680-Amphidinium_carterae.1
MVAPAEPFAFEAVAAGIHVTVFAELTPCLRLKSLVFNGIGTLKLQPDRTPMRHKLLFDDNRFQIPRQPFPNSTKCVCDVPHTMQLQIDGCRYFALDSTMVLRARLLHIVWINPV